MQGRRLPALRRIEIAVIGEQVPELPGFGQGTLDYVTLAGTIVARLAENGKLRPDLARRGPGYTRYAVPALIFTCFHQEDPVVGGGAPDKIALRRAIAMGFDKRPLRRRVREVPARAPARSRRSGAFRRSCLHEGAIALASWTIMAAAGAPEAPRRKRTGGVMQKPRCETFPGRPAVSGRHYAGPAIAVGIIAMALSGCASGPVGQAPVVAARAGDCSALVGVASEMATISAASAVAAAEMIGTRITLVTLRRWKSCGLHLNAKRWTQ